MRAREALRSAQFEATRGEREEGAGVNPERGGVEAGGGAGRAGGERANQGASVGAGDRLHAVILAGGRGTRFWPLSTGRRPKQLLRILGERTMIQETAERLLPLVPSERWWVVTAAEQAVEVARQLPALRSAQLLAEPVGRNTAPAIGLAARHIAARDPEALMVVLPADHVIRDPGAFRGALAAGARAAAAHPVLVTLGIPPTRPETGYGYIERGASAGEFEGQVLYEVVAFREKPDPETAARYVAGGRHAWNAGVFLFRARVVSEEIQAHLPELAQVLGDPALTQPGERGAQALSRAYERAPSISIDYGVLERSARTWTLPVDCGWNDVGSWSALGEVRTPDAEGNVVVGEAVLLDSRNVLVHAAEGPLVALLGVEDMVVVSTRGAVLVCPRGRAQEVRKLVEELERRGRQDLI
jgi:mannose-1-phosphate guanylyltransferase